MSRAKVPRLPSAVTEMQRSPLRCTIFVWLHTGFTSATWRSATDEAVGVVR